jgi:hypothetical protein
MTLFRRGWLKKIKLEEVAEISSDDWAIVWSKLGLVPQISGRSLIGELELGGRPAIPIYAQLGYNSRIDVVEALKNVLHLSEPAALLFLGCTLNRDSVEEVVEDYLLSNDIPDGS